MPVERNQASERLLPPWYVQALFLGHFHRADRVVVGFGIQCPQNRGFVCGDADHAAAPLGDLSFIGVGFSLNISEQIVVVALERLMIAGLSPEVENQLRRAYQCDDTADKLGVDAVHVEQATNCGGAQANNSEVEYPVRPLKGSASRSVIVRVTQDVEADQFRVGLGHLSVVGFGGAGVSLVVGCLGPLDPPTTGTLTAESVGWRPPAELMLMFSPLRGFATPNAIRVSLSLIEVLSFCSLQKGMKVAGGCSYTRQSRKNTTRSAGIKAHSEILGVAA